MSETIAMTQPSPLVRGRPRSNSMPAFSPDTTPVVKQYQRRRSVYQSLAALNPLDFLHLHREKFRPAPTQPSRAEKKENLASSKGLASRGFKFSLRRRRGPASRVVIHQTKLPVVIREAEVEDELPTYEESVSQDSCMNCDAENSAATITEDTITVCQPPSSQPVTIIDDTVSAVVTSQKSNIIEAETTTIITETTKLSHIQPLELPFYGPTSNFYPRGYAPPPHNTAWHNSLTRPYNALNAYFASPHCPRLTGQCCKCGAMRGVCRHFNVDWQIPHSLINGLITRSGNSGMIPPYGGVNYGFYPGDGQDWDWTVLEGCMFCPCGRGCRCECVAKILEPALAAGRERERERSTRRLVEVHNIHTDVGIQCHQHDGCHHGHTCYGHVGRGNWWGGHRGRREYYGGGGCCDGCGHGSNSGREECVEIRRRNGETLQICQRGGGGGGRYRRRRGYGQEISCVIC
ncbi:hypothetical protein TWF506_001506 [Arthrobotrys conoides]|uniref:Uncharacterized protein n=1 Tax=Arthrobotrys conoides TaxID=74498 RepID=A0AAN8RRC9_9PEZI